MDEKEVLEMIKAGNLGDSLSEISNDLKVIGRVLREHGVYFYGGECIGPAIDFLDSGDLVRGWNKILPIRDLKAFIEDPSQYKADGYGVSKEHYLAWKEFQESPSKCSAITKKGDRCQAHFFRQGALPCLPEQFDPEEKYYCSTHDRCGVEECI